GAGEASHPVRRHRWLVRPQDRGRARGHRGGGRVSASEAADQVDRGPQRAFDGVGPGARRDHGSGAGLFGGGRSPGHRCRHDRRHRCLSGHGRDDHRPHRADVAGALQDRGCRFPLQGGGHQQGDLRRLPRPVGGRGVHPRAHDRHRRPPARHGAARHPSPHPPPPRPPPAPPPPPPPPPPAPPPPPPPPAPPPPAPPPPPPAPAPPPPAPAAPPPAPAAPPPAPAPPPPAPAAPPPAPAAPSPAPAAPAPAPAAPPPAPAAPSPAPAAPA